MEMKTDVAIIGGGPGGYVSAIRLAQLGKKVALIEKERLGGACLNRGCVPMKAYLAVAKPLREVNKGSRMGIVGTAAVDFKRVQSWKDGIVERSRRGLESIMRHDGVEVISGSAALEGPGKVRLSSGEIVSADSVVIATGSRPTDLRGIRFDGNRILSSDDIFRLNELPGRLAIVGGGVIGIEMASAFSQMGVKISVVEMMDQILPGWSSDLIAPVQDSLTKGGVEIRTATRVEKVEYSNGALQISLEGGGAIEADRLLVAVGRKPNVEGIGLEKAGIALDEKGFIKVDSRFETSVQGIYAIGDVIGLPYLAHKSSEQGLWCAEIIAGIKDAHIPAPIPSVVYSDPEIATVGVSEEEARKRGIPAVVGKFNFAASSRALTLGRVEGFVRLIGDGSDALLIGAEIVGQGASDLISECSMAMRCSLTLEEISSSVHPHPTLSEAIMEAARTALGKPIHGLRG